MSLLAPSLPAGAAEAEAIPAGQRNLPIDLPTALRLANAQNLQVALAREQIRQALARVEAAQVLWLPSIRGGLNYNRHDGAIQAVDGTQFNTSRAAFDAGLGAGIYGAGTPMIPGIYANFHLTDALFQPLAARQFAGARNRAAMAATNDALLEVSLAYLELLRAHEDLAISQGIHARVQTLTEITAHYARTGQGLQADADRLQTELMLRKNDVLRGEEACQVASARLAQLLHLDPTIFLEPIEPTIVPLDLTPPEIPLTELVAQGLSRRPELAESRLLVAEAVTRLRRERLAPLLPSVLLGTSYGAMSAGINTNMAPGAGRLDADAVAYWELRNLGLGDQAARDGASSMVRQAQVRQLAVMDQISREVTEASAQSQARRRQIGIAREGVQAAVESHQRNLDRIEAAKGLPIEALQSVQALANAQREYLRSLVDYDAAQFALYRALGWPVRLDLPAANPPSPAQPRSSRKAA
ncbi:MAG TPA: TolC family protein [Pirellulales bacterium]|nr:TolC family protein [Pirellulales bacterium]